MRLWYLWVHIPKGDPNLYIRSTASPDEEVIGRPVYSNMDSAYCRCIYHGSHGTSEGQGSYYLLEKWGVWGTGLSARRTRVLASRQRHHHPEKSIQPPCPHHHRKRSSETLLFGSFSFVCLLALLTISLYTGVF